MAPLVSMHPALDRLHSGLARHLAGIDAAHTQLRTGDDVQRWSVQQIVEHLLLTYTATNENFRQRLESAVGTKVPATLQDRLGQFIVCTLGMFPKGRKSPEAVMPSTDAEPASGDQMLMRIDAELRRFDGLAREAERVFGSKRAVRHLVLGPMSVHNWRLFHLRHGEHHLRQVAAILAARRG